LRERGGGRVDNRRKITPLYNIENSNEEGQFRVTKPSHTETLLVSLQKRAGSNQQLVTDTGVLLTSRLLKKCKRKR
jgi:hypothetical protein